MKFRKINYRKVLVAVLWIVAGAGLASSLAFASKSERNVKVKKLKVDVHNDTENLFLSEKDVENYLAEGEKPIVNNVYKNISIPEIEKTLNAHPAIENAEVAAEVNGELRIDVVQRTPVCRIINMDGESYYIDSQSKLMPLSDNYTARVIVASGNITEPYARRYQYSVKQIAENKIYSEVSMLDDILEMANYINADSTLSALVQQIYVNDEKDMILFPSIGKQKIIFGGTENMALKFNKLKLFYTEGLNKTDSWNKYSEINLKYDNLVVCTKK